MKWLWILILFSHSASAEYRAYELQITNAATGKTSTVISTLDQYQYPGYWHLNPGDTVTYVNSWMCWGRTSEFMSICSAANSTTSPVVNPTAANPNDPALQVPTK